MFRRAQLLLVSIAIGMGVLAVLTAVTFGHPLVDPDGFLGPSWLRFPLLLSLAFGIDLVPRTLWVSRLRPTRMRDVWQTRVREHWTRPRMALVVTGLLGFYVTYVSYRNLKSQVPFVEGRHHTFDFELNTIDKALFLGHFPGPFLHGLLGTGIAAEVLSTVYLWFLPLVPLCLTGWLIWAKDLAHGYWFATSQCIAWTLGTISYYALPTIGPGLDYPFRYQGLDHTGAIRLMASIQWTRQTFLNDAAGSLQSVAGFASLHCAITLLVTLMVQYTLRNRWIKIFFWVNFCLTVVATLYYGWHYVADDVAGVAIALVAFYVGGLASNQTFVRHRTMTPELRGEVTPV
ncbi:MAG: phosphatase PAP2 family protein [Nocardioides sp.]